MAPCEGAATINFLAGISVATGKGVATGNFLIGVSVAPGKGAATVKFLAGAAKYVKHADESKQDSRA